MKDQRRATRDQWRDGLENGGAYGGTILPGRSDEELIGRFKGQLAWTAGMIVFLGMINATTSPQFPWAIFPSMGMTMGAIGRYSKMRARGITWTRIWEDEPDAQREPTDAAGVLPRPQRIARAARAFKRHFKWLVASAATAGVSFAIGSGFNLDPMIVPFVAGLIGSAISAQLLIVDYVRLRRFGVPPGDALGDGWKEIAAMADDRPRYMQLNEVLERIAGPAVLMSSHGETVRSAVDDRMTIKDTSSRLSDADKAMVPDVEPTADALLERIGALASGLERLERDVPGDAIAQLDTRIATAQAEPETAPDHERRLALLTRQRASLQELLDRRVTMQRQMESAAMALRSLRFDMVKLRTLGVGAAIGDVTSATQEARALSLDIGRALYAAEEVRKL